MFRLLGRTPNTGSNENKTTTIIVKNSPNNNAQWKGTDSNSSNSPISTPQQRKISSASFSGRSHYISPSGTRFVPVDPRGLVSMQKNSASNSITSSKSNSPIAAIPSTPSPASYINSPPRCEIINPNVDIRTPRGETNQNIFG
uniref:Candidate secreted effector n=1 Tax=Meloidogyne incognita TaxID=6306 RepID=A0A914NR79_MELIC